jgi:predicted Rossmann fold nucleotide-binding protein DprA/Smf involved in DNA uptake
VSETDAAARKSAIRGLMRRLSQARGTGQATARGQYKEQSARRRRVIQHLRSGPSTVPELAAATGVPAAEVMVIVATLRRYGVVAEDEQQESYFRYRLLAAEGE